MISSFGSCRQAAHDLHPLPLADRKVMHRRIGIELQPVGVRDLGDARLQPAPALRIVDRERDVLRDGQCLEQREVLEHHADPEIPRGGGTCNLDRVAVPADLAFVGAHHAVDDLDQGRLARPVLAQQRMDLAGADLEADAVIGDGHREALHDAVEGEQRLLVPHTRHRAPSASIIPWLDSIRVVRRGDSFRRFLAAVQQDSRPRPRLRRGFDSAGGRD